MLWALALFVHDGHCRAENRVKEGNKKLVCAVTLWELEQTQEGAGGSRPESTDTSEDLPWLELLSRVRVPKVNPQREVQRET